MAAIKPWGQLRYLLAEFGERSWTCFSTASFEDRCTAVPSELAVLGVLDQHRILKIVPPSDGQHRIACLAGVNASLANLLLCPGSTHLEVGLLESLASPRQWMLESLADESSIVLDISAMPKRFFMFLVNVLMDDARVSDLIVTYTKPFTYPEGSLAVDHEPIASLAGLMREEEPDGPTAAIIGAGFVQFSLSEYLEQAQGSDVSILFPFPPGAPSSRRNWKLLHKMDPNAEMRAEIRRIHAMDFFHALDWINGVIKGCAAPKVDMIPLGPKPHSLAMALAFRAARSSSSVLYAQPHSYRPDYSLGVALTDDGFPDIYAYCLKRSGEQYA